MLRSEIIKGASKIVEALNKGNLDSLYLRLRRAGSTDRGTIGEVFDSYEKFKKISRNFTAIEHMMMELLGLTELENPGWWATLSGDRVGESVAVFNNVRQSLQFLPKFASLLARTTDELGNSALNQDDLAGKPVLRLLLPEKAGELSSPERVTNALQAITEFYGVFAELDRRPATDLALLACDSGSDKSFDFTGIPQIISEIRATILAIWDRAVFYREKRTQEQVELVGRSLPVLERIAQLEQQGLLEREKAELLRRSVVSGTTKFMGAGALIPEISEAPPTDPSTILSTDRRLLLSGPTKSNGNSGRPEADSRPEENDDSFDDVGELTEEEKQALKQMRRGTGKAPE